MAVVAELLEVFPVALGDAQNSCGDEIRLDLHPALANDRRKGVLGTPSSGRRGQWKSNGLSPALYECLVS